MRMLVIGRSGQLARALAATRRSNCAIEAIGRPDVDLAGDASLEGFIASRAPDVVVNAAAYTAVDRAESEREAAFALNAHGAGTLARATSALGLPLIHVSTDYVFDGQKPTPYVESDPTGPINAYGDSKLAGERLVAAANPRHVIVRTAWVVSQFGANFCKTMLRLAKDRDELRVVADQHGAPTYAPDLAVALLSVAEQVQSLSSGDPRFGIYHLSNAGEATWADVAEATLAVSDSQGGRSVPVHRITTAEFPTPARRPANSRLDCGRIHRSFGIALPPWQDAVQRCVVAITQGE